jgi:DNA-directed RNA polymerase subunit RPC12/RpoP
MSSNFLVSTECPTCGAPLDFLEGANAVQCIHCKSNLLVTGRKQVLSYFVRPQLDIHRGVAKAMIAHKEVGHSGRMISPQLYFIPYYRLIGHDFRWEVKAKERKIPEDHSTLLSDPFREPEGSVVGAASQWLNLLFGKESLPSFPQNMPLDQNMMSSKNPLKENHEVIFQDQYVEKNFIGSKCKEFGVYSLGVRPSVLKLELFGKSSLETLGKVVRPDITPEEAFERGMKTAGGENLLFREVLAWMLSLVYFPFWVMEVEIEGERCLTVLDAVSESVIQLKIPLSLSETLSHPLTEEPKVIQFRPLVCPNCGWDLSVKKEDVIFFCNSCKKPWQIMGDTLSEVAYQVMLPPDPPGEGGVKYLPFWIIDVDPGQSVVSRYFIPGFRYRRLKILADLAAALTKKNPSYTLTDNQGIDAFGCFYDQEDAVNLAKVAEAGIMLRTAKAVQSNQLSPISPKKIILSWIPFHSNGDFLIEPFTSLSISQSLLG